MRARNIGSAFPFASQALATGQLFRDRAQAGAALGERLVAYRGEHPLVLGVPRGGVPVAAEVARAVDGDLDVLVARKLGAPGSPELAIGAVTADGGRYLNERMLDELGISREYVERETAAQMEEARRRELRFRAGAPAREMHGRTVIIVDDGLATGATMFAAVHSARARSPARLVVAVPVGSREATAMLRGLADEVVCLAEPDPFWAVGLYYRDFGQTEDEEVERLLRETAPAAKAGRATASAPG